MDDEEYFDIYEHPQTHKLLINGSDVGIGVQDSAGQIRLKLRPAVVLDWRDRLDIRIVTCEQRNERDAKATRERATRRYPR